MDKLKHLEYKFSIATYELLSACDPEELKFYLWLKLWAIGKDKHHAWPGFQIIAKEFNLAHRNARMMVQRIESKGKLKVTRNGGQSNIYDITEYDRLVLPINKDESIPRDDDILRMKTSHEQVQNKNVSEKEKNLKEREEKEKNFEVFWTAYPVKVQKKKAASIWSRLSPIQRDSALRDVPIRREQDDQWKRGFVPHPTTYLNGERWNDQVIKSKEEENVHMVLKGGKIEKWVNGKLVSIT